MSVAAKIQQVMSRVGYIKKDKQLEGGGKYKYLSEEAVTAELHSAFADIGLVIIPTAMEILDNREDATRNGGILFNTRIRATYLIMDPDDGTSLQIQTLGEGADSGDKAINKCMTGAYKYALRQSFVISTGDDPDHTASQESTASTRKNPQTTRPATTAQRVTTPAGESATAPSAPITVTSVESLAMERGLTEAAFRALLARAYKVDSLTKLTSELLTDFDAKLRKLGPDHVTAYNQAAEGMAMPK